ncbi:MAG: hypothetical protein DSY43_05910 [Gammaproteobacteria bacterium]|nr:MAG: hypothetical protein DSY43_05910 [Gammaproteobacteria bacterium]
MACFMSFKDQGRCGEFKEKSELVSLGECNNDITPHLRRCHLSKERISECELILLRAGYFDTTPQQIKDMFVCPKHRGYLGLYWKNQTRKTPCQYPEHKGKRKGATTDRSFTVKMAKEVNIVYGIMVPIGSRE